MAFLAFEMVEANGLLRIYFRGYLILNKDVGANAEGG